MIVIILEVNSKLYKCPSFGEFYHIKDAIAKLHESKTCEFVELNELTFEWKTQGSLELKFYFKFFDLDKQEFILYRSPWKIGLKELIYD